MTKTVWHKGPPPSVGWWPASSLRNAIILRWWDGTQWSLGVPMYRDEVVAADLAEHPADDSDIEWTDRPPLILARME